MVNPLKSSNYSNAPLSSIEWAEDEGRGKAIGPGARTDGRRRAGGHGRTWVGEAEEGGNGRAHAAGGRTNGRQTGKTPVAAAGRPTDKPVGDGGTLYPKNLKP